MGYELNYEDDIEIDETALDVEWLEQPRLMLRYCKHAEAARRDLDIAKEALDVEKAMLEKAIRANPEAFDILKTTESAIQAAIIAHEKHRTKVAAYIDYKYEAGLAQAAVKAVDTRKTALENLVKLHGMAYFAGPSVPRNLTEEKIERNKSSNRMIKMRRQG